MMDKQLRLVLIGKTGAGKSKTGNTILNLTAKGGFPCGSQGSSLTKCCNYRENMVFGRRVSIVDTPELLDTHKEENEILHEITKCIYMSAPGPHAILLTVPVGRFTAENVETVTTFVRHFGEEILRYLVIIFTRFDDYKRDNEDIDDLSIYDYIPSLPDMAKHFVTQKCNSRVVGFDNTLRGSDAEKQVVELFSVIDTMVNRNGGKCYTNDDYQQAEQAVREEMRKEEIRLKQQLEKETRGQEETDRAADEKAKKQMKEEMKQMELKMRERLLIQNLRKEVQASPGEEFQKFEMVSSIVGKLAEVVLKGFEMYLEAKYESRSLFHL